MKHIMDDSEFNLSLTHMARALNNLPEHIVDQRKNKILIELGLHREANKKTRSLKKEKQNG